MKIATILILLITAFSCTVNNEENEEVLDVKEFYYPIDQMFGRVIYQYDLLVLNDGVRDDSQKVIYAVFEKIDKDRISMCSYNQEFEISDSIVVHRSPEGIEVESCVVYSDGIGAIAEVDENLIYPWKRKRSETSKLNLDYEMVVYDALCQISSDVTVGSAEIGQLKNTFNGEREYLKLSAESDDSFLNKSTGELLEITSSGYIIDLKGVGLYISVYSNKYGTKRRRELKLILSSDEWSRLRNEAKNRIDNEY